MPIEGIAIHFLSNDVSPSECTHHCGSASSTPGEMSVFEARKTKYVF